MAFGLDVKNAPFDRLSEAEAERARSLVDVGYFRPGHILIAEKREPEGLFVVIKGSVEEREGEALVALHGPGDWFDSRALVRGLGSNAYVAREETLCHVLPRAAALRLIDENPRFAAYFFSDISAKLGAAAREADAERLRPMMNARVFELFLHPAIFIEAKDTLEAAGRALAAGGAYALFVKDGSKVGVLTGTDLWEAAILKRLPISSPVGPLAQFNVVAVAKDDFVSAALLKMTKHNKRRVAVHNDGLFVGFLEDTDLLGFLAGGAQLLAGRIDRAASLADLGVAANEIAAQTRILRRQGVRIDVVCEIVSELNRALFSKTFALAASASIRERSCLIVMGSEGRGEQTIRTDQDNGLILAEAPPEAELQAFRDAFSAALNGFGFPPCPGGVMASNPFWSREVEAFEADIRRWTAAPDESGALNVAILYDAAAVAGDESLLRRIKGSLIAATRGEQAFLAHFARAIDAFPTPIGLFNNLLTADGQGDALDLKKGGIFPIVHGVRSLALERGLMECGTSARIERLRDEGAFKPDFATELIEAFRYLMTLRLDAQLAAAAGSLVKPAELTTLDRDLLRDALKLAKRLKEIVRHRFNLGMF